MISFQAFFVLFMGGIIVPWMVILQVTDSHRADIFNALAVIGLTEAPMVAVANVLTYKPYRQFILSLFLKVSG